MRDDTLLLGLGALGVLGYLGVRAIESLPRAPSLPDINFGVDVPQLGITGVTGAGTKQDPYVFGFEGIPRTQSTGTLYEAQGEERRKLLQEAKEKSETIQKFVTTPAQTEFNVWAQEQIISERNRQTRAELVRKRQEQQSRIFGGEQNIVKAIAEVALEKAPFEFKKPDPQIRPLSQQEISKFKQKFWESEAAKAQKAVQAKIDKLKSQSRQTSTGVKPTSRTSTLSIADVTKFEADAERRRQFRLAKYGA